MSYFEFPFDFPDILVTLGINDFTGVLNAGGPYVYSIANAPTNETDYNAWMVWNDDRTMPTWAYLTGDGLALYQGIKRQTVAKLQDVADVGNDLQSQVDAIPAGVSISSATRSIVTSTSDTGFQVSSSRMSNVAYSISIAATLSLTTGQSSTVYIETAATNSTTPSDWSIVKSVTNSNTGILTAGLSLVQTMAFDVSGYIPAGNYVRIRSSGTATCSYISGQEALV